MDWQEGWMRAVAAEGTGMGTNSPKQGMDNNLLAEAKENHWKLRWTLPYMECPPGSVLLPSPCSRSQTQPQPQGLGVRLFSVGPLPG